MRHSQFYTILLGLSLTVLTSCSTLTTQTTSSTIKALIIDGQNNHAAWPETTQVMKQYLEETGRFNVDIYRTRYTWKSDRLTARTSTPQPTEPVKSPISDPHFKPNFHQYDVIISNFGWKAAAWPQTTKAQLENYIRHGGGLVIVHAASNAFADWDAYNQMIGLGGWGGRSERNGPYVYFENNKEIRDHKKGRAGRHGKKHRFTVTLQNTTHPITQGMPKTWLHTKDECYERLRGPAKNLTVLATAYCSKDQKGSGRNEPALMSITYGEGRIFHTTLGHDLPAFSGTGFKTYFIRGTEWAATSKSQYMPNDDLSVEQILEFNRE